MDNFSKDLCDKTHEPINAKLLEHDENIKELYGKTNAQALLTVEIATNLKNISDQLASIINAAKWAICGLIVFGLGYFVFTVKDHIFK